MWVKGAHGLSEQVNYQHFNILIQITMKSIP